MKQFSVLMLVFVSYICVAGQPTSFSEAWSYISAKDRSERWLVISSSSKEGFFECENLDDAVRCTLPVWTKLLPNVSKRVLPIGGQEKPYPEIEGTQLNQLTPSQDLEKAKAIFVSYRLDPFYVYSQVKDESGQVVGTQCDLRVMLDLRFDKFESLAKRYLHDMFGITDKSDYRFETNS